MEESEHYPRGSGEPLKDLCTAVWSLEVQFWRGTPEDTGRQCGVKTVGI